MLKAFGSLRFTRFIVSVRLLLTFAILNVIFLDAKNFPEVQYVFFSAKKGGLSNEPAWKMIHTLKHQLPSLIRNPPTHPIPFPLPSPLAHASSQHHMHDLSIESHNTVRDGNLDA